MRKVIFVLAASAASISLFPAPAASGVLSAIFGHIWELGAEEPLSKVPLVKPTPKLVPREPLRVPREAAPLVVSPIIGSEPVAGATTEGGASTAAGTSHFGTSDSSAGAKAEGGSSTGDGTSDSGSSQSSAGTDDDASAGAESHEDKSGEDNLDEHLKHAAEIGNHAAKEGAQQAAEMQKQEQDQEKIDKEFEAMKATLEGR